MDIFACEIREKKIKEVALVPNWKFTDPRKVVVKVTCTRLDAACREASCQKQ